MELLDETRIALHHKRAVILGKSDVFLRPLAHGLSLMGLDPVLAGSDPAAPLAAALLQRADVVVTAIGKAGILTSNSLRESAVVIDIGQTPKSGRLSGDFDVSTAEGRVRFYTPVPGGVGPVTVAAMIHAVAVRCQNTLRALGRA
jgi:methylenetetrahydrofolate dehydrogenase (NADP+)/methenyltetrahydrofolate cyclohydrolase